MGKIIGESFDPYVDAQVKIRQKKLGQLNRSDDLLTKVTSKNPWLRLTSGVDIVTSKKASEIGVNFPSNPADYFQLQGGPLRGRVGSTVDSYEGDKFTPRGGIIDSYGNDLTQAYGYKSSAEFGLVPLPSLESFSVTPKNNGSLTQADITIKCYNKSQFQIIETLYLRLGFTLLLEWGHSVYTDNDGTLITNPTNKQVSRKFLNPQTDDPLKEIQDLIATERKDSCGNYDGLIGRVTNFDWDVTPDGHYTAKVKLTSTGDVIDSLKINNPLPSPPIKGGEEDAEIPDYKENVESTPLGRIIKTFKEALDGKTPEVTKVFGKPLEIQTSNGLFGRIFNTLNVRFYSSDALSNSKITKATFENKIGAYNDQEGRANREILRVNGQGWGDYYYYIKFGALLRIIQNFLLIYDTKHNNTPITKIDWKYNDNQCFTPLQDIFSADPRILLVPSLFKRIDEKGNNVSFKGINSTIGTEFYGEGNNFTFNFMHAHINMDFAIQALTDNLGAENEILLIDFVQTLCEGINQSLSNLIQLEPFHDQNDNTLYIVNKCNSDELLTNQPPVTKFRVGLLPQGEREGSFVKDVSIGSTIPPNFATQIAIGAQANDNEISSNSTPFSDWNKGLSDRIITEKKTATQIEKERKEAEEAEVEAQKKREEEEKEFEAALQSTIAAAKKNNEYDFRDELFKLESSVKEYFKIQANKFEKDKASKAITPIIIPISLNLTIDGLSGIKIFQKYTITEDFLPDNYQDSIEFIVKGIAHNIDAGGWTTKIEGQCIPKVKYASV